MTVLVYLLLIIIIFIDCKINFFFPWLFVCFLVTMVNSQVPIHQKHYLWVSHLLIKNFHMPVSSVHPVTQHYRQRRIWKYLFLSVWKYGENSLDQWSMTINDSLWSMNHRKRQMGHYALFLAVYNILQAK